MQIKLSLQIIALAENAKTVYSHNIGIKQEKRKVEQVGIYSLQFILTISCSDRGLMQLFLFFLFSMKLSSYFPLSLSSNLLVGIKPETTHFLGMSYILGISFLTFSSVAFAPLVFNLMDKIWKCICFSAF